jgi:sialic acid synthase SpsE
MTGFRVGPRRVGPDEPVFFVADIAANHDGELERATELIRLAAEAGADAAKFQHFSAATIVSDRGFRALGSQASHQAKWSRSVYEVYEGASLPADWTPALRAACDDAGIAFMTAPYSLELAESLSGHVDALKIGSGDITWLELLDDVSRRGLPVMLATGASTADEVARAVAALRRGNAEIVLMQCNTNYTGSLENFANIHLNVLRSYAVQYPDVVLGLSDHTPGHSTALGAVALGARVIEKHFTDDQRREGPDHAFSMAPAEWREMVDRSRELEAALGSAVKDVAANELETVVLQRRAIRAARDLVPGRVIERGDLEVLRPCPPDGLAPSLLPAVVGATTARHVSAGDHVRWSDLR